MSVESLAIAFNHSRATGTAKLILLGIANHDGDGGAWPSMATLARYGNVNVRNAQKAIAKLEELGEIRVHVQQGGNARTPDHVKPNLYEFILTCSPDCDRTKNHRSRYELIDPLSVATPGVGTDRGTPVGSDTPPLSVATPEPYINHPRKDIHSQGDHKSARKVQPAPKLPPLSEVGNVPKIARPTPEDAALYLEAGKLRCTAHDGKYRHLIDPATRECVRCDLTAETILERQPA